MTTTPPNVLLRSEETDGVVSAIELGPPLESAPETRRSE